MTSAQESHGKQVAFSSYLGLGGSDLRSADGVVYCNSNVRLADIRDGLSSTLLAGERPPSADLFFGWWYAGYGQRGTGSTDMTLGVREVNVRGPRFSGCAPGPYHFARGQLSNQCDQFHFWSLHAGGANFAFCDGSVRFLGYAADSVLPALATRAGGEVAVIPD